LGLRRRAVDLVGDEQVGEDRTGVKLEPARLEIETLVPRMSLGIRSGVNCTRLQSRRSSRASVRAMSVLAVPGTPSSRMWPPQINASSTNSRLSRWPMTTRSARFSRCSTNSGTDELASTRTQHLGFKLVEGPGPRQQLRFGNVSFTQLRRPAQQGVDALGGIAGVALPPGREDLGGEGCPPQMQ